MPDSAVGGLAALGSAFFFALAAMFFCRLGHAVSPAGINVGKGLISVALMAMVLLAQGAGAVGWRDGGLLAISGLIGITIGDTVYFAALTRLGPRRTLVLDTLSPGIAVLLCVIFLAERPTPWQWVGMATTIVGVGWVMRERAEEAETEGGAPARDGLWYGILSVLCHVGGMMLSKLGLEPQVPVLEASMIRQGVALVALVGWGLATRQLQGWVAPLAHPRQLRLLLPAAFLGTFVGIYLSLLGLKLIPAGVANTLTSTTPLFILPLTALSGGEKLTLRAVVGAMAAVGGVALLVLS